ATLAGARDDAEAQALLDLIPDLVDERGATVRRRVDGWLRDLYDGPDRWNPLRPDRLGEALVARVLAEQDDVGVALLTAVLGLVSDAQVERALDVLVRLAANPSVAPVAAVALAGRYASLVGRCVDQARGRGGEKMNTSGWSVERQARTGLLDGLCRAHTALLTADRAADLPPALQTQLSVDAVHPVDLARDNQPGPDA